MIAGAGGVEVLNRAREQGCVGPVDMHSKATSKSSSWPERMTVSGTVAIVIPLHRVSVVAWIDASA